MTDSAVSDWLGNAGFYIFTPLTTINKEDLKIAVCDAILCAHEHRE